MTALPANGISMHVRILEPERQAAVATAVMVHGLGDDTMASWYFTLAQPLCDAGFRVVLYDLRGHGYSERPAGGYQVDDFVNDLEGLLAATRIDGMVHLLGNSFGGTIAFRYAARHPQRVAAIVAVEAAPPAEGWLRTLARLLRQARDAPSSMGRQPFLRWAQTAEGLLRNTTLVEDIAASSASSQAELDKITCSVLCIFGADSGLADLATTVPKRLPSAQVVLIPGQRHSVLINQPGQLREVILPWLDRINTQRITTQEVAQ